MESSKFKRGDEVRRRGSPRSRGIVMNGPIDHGSGPQYDIQWVQPQPGRGFAPEQDLEPFEAAAAPAWVGRDDFLAHIGLVKLVDPFTNVLLSMGWSRTEFHPYQFIPALQFVQHARHGLLIADEVGLGKTIEAALVLRELMARGRMDRVLVVCPANLRSKWRDELSHRFDLKFDLLRGAELEEQLKRMQRDGVEPALRAIVSFESIRRGEDEARAGSRGDVRRAIEESGITFDLVIFDEAHHMRNAPTRTSRVGRTLSESSDHVLLLSATPLQTDRDDLLTLLRLLEPSIFSPMNPAELDEFLEPNRGINSALEELSRLVADPARVAACMREAAETPAGAALRDNPMFSHWLNRLSRRSEPLGPERIMELRRVLHDAHTLSPYYSRSRKREVQPNPPQRRPLVENVQLDEREQAFYNALTDYLKLREGARPGNLAPSFAVITRERIAASCLRAARDVLDALLHEDETGAEDALGYEGEDSSIRDRVARARPSNDAELEAAAEAVRAAADDLPDSDGKMDALIKMIRHLLETNSSRKMLVFTTFRGTLSYLEERLEHEGIGFSSVSGAVPVADRPALIERFRDDEDQRVLLSTEVAAEGVDLQFCDAIINYDLPWNPMRVEQRIGRIDRFGQESPAVAVASFNVSDTIDSRILDRLYQRINVFEESIGELEPIFRQAIPELQADIFAPDLTPAERQRRADDRILQIQQQRGHLDRLASSAAQLMGHGALLQAEIESAERAGRYVSAAEAEAVARRWIAETSRPGARPESRLEPSRHPSARRLRLARPAVEAARKIMANERLDDDDAGRLFAKLAAGGPVEITFDRAFAAQRGAVPFIHIAHPVIRAAVELLRQVPDAGWLGRMCAFRIPAEHRGRLLERFAGWGVLLAVFRLAVRDGVAAGAPELRIVPIAVDIADRPRELPRDLAEQLMGFLPSAEAVAGAPIIPEQALAAALEAAPLRAEQRRLAILEDQRDTRNARAAQQRQTLNRTYAVKIDSARLRAAGASDPRIKRMNETRLRNLRAELGDKLSDLGTAPEPTADIELIAAAVFTPA